MGGHRGVCAAREGDVHRSPTVVRQNADERVEERAESFPATRTVDRPVHEKLPVGTRRVARYLLLQQHVDGRWSANLSGTPPSCRSSREKRDVGLIGGEGVVERRSDGGARDGIILPGKI